MIIRELKLQPFAGLANHKVSFKKGLNVILGPNEAGKSTIISALQLVLFQTTQYDRRAFRQAIEPYIPLGGGDTVRVELTFGIGKKVYRLEKSWGSSTGTRLTLPRGELMTDPETTEDKLEELLVLREGTYQSVLFANQSAVSETLDSLDEGSELVEDLASVLRRAVFETDGVSVEKLGQILNEQQKQYFGRWDGVLDRPEGGRGIDNQWVKGVGGILSQYYAKEQLKVRLAEVLEYEAGMDSLNQQMQGLLSELAPLREFVRENKETVDRARTRRTLEAEITALRVEENQLRGVSQQWPALAQKLETQRQSLVDLEGRRKSLTDELQRAEAYESSKLRIDKQQRAKKKKEEWEKALKGLRGLKAVDESDLRSLESVHGELSRLETSLEAGKITLNMVASKPADIRVTRDLDQEAAYSLTAGESLDLSAGGQIRIDHTDWTIRVKSGEVDIEDLRRSVDAARHEYNVLLDRLSVTDLVEAKKHHELYKAQATVVENLRRQLEEILDGEEYDALKALAKSLDKTPAPRKVSAIAVELGQVETGIGQVQRDIGSTDHQLQDWAKLYESQDRLLDLLVEKRAALKEREPKLKQLKPLPGEIENPEELIQDFEGKQETLDAKEAELSELRIERAGLQARAPEEAAEEVETRLKEAEGHLQRVKREAAAVVRIAGAYSERRAAMDAQTMDPWFEELRKAIPPLTGDRYGDLVLEEGASRLQRSDGLQVPFSALSMGTEVGLGLAVRMSMASYFLRDLEGFLVLDDPLVDLDPDRQQAAARVIWQFARSKQVIVVTCHPSHADILGGHAIPMEAP